MDSLPESAVDKVSGHRRRSLRASLRLAEGIHQAMSRRIVLFDGRWLGYSGWALLAWHVLAEAGHYSFCNDSVKLIVKAVNILIRR